MELMSQVKKGSVDKHNAWYRILYQNTFAAWPLSSEFIKRILNIYLSVVYNTPSLHILALAYFSLLSILS